jgi:Flp pilus assembly pilin Flp
MIIQFQEEENGIAAAEYLSVCLAVFETFAMISNSSEIWERLAAG